MQSIRSRSLFHLSPPAHRPFRHHLPCGHVTMSSSQSSIIEHVVLFKLKPSADPSAISSMVDGLNSLTSLPQVLHLSAGPIHRNHSFNHFPFTHLLHSRYRSKEDLAGYSAHPSHVSVVKEKGLPICEDIMAVDWVGGDVSGPIRPGAALRITLLKLKDGIKDEEREGVLKSVEGVREVLGVEGSVGENFSPGRAKGFSVCSVAVYGGGVGEMEKANEGNKEVLGKEKEKVREYVDGVVDLEYVVMGPQSASL